MTCAPFFELALHHWLFTFTVVLVTSATHERILILMMLGCFWRASPHKAVPSYLRKCWLLVVLLSTKHPQPLPPPLQTVTPKSASLPFPNEIRHSAVAHSASDQQFCTVQNKKDYICWRAGSEDLRVRATESIVWLFLKMTFSFHSYPRCTEQSACTTKSNNFHDSFLHKVWAAKIPIFSFEIGYVL